MWNVANVDPEAAAHKVEVLRGHCEEIGRDLAEIELSVSLGPVLIRDNDAEAGESSRASTPATPT